MKKLDPEDLGEIWGVLNQAGEKLELHEPIPVTPAIESWMVKLELQMKHAVAVNLSNCYKSHAKEDFIMWISNWPT